LGDIFSQESKRLRVWFEAQNPRLRIKAFEVKNRESDVPSAIDDERLAGLRLEKVNVPSENVVVNDSELAVIAVGYLVAIGKRLRLQLERHKIGSRLLDHAFQEQQYGKASERQVVGRLRPTLRRIGKNPPSFPKFPKCVLLEERRERATAEMFLGPTGLHGRKLGEVAEWLNAAVLKTAVGLAPTVGSNPTLSANE
jgi:hypothetical protein